MIRDKWHQKYSGVVDAAASGEIAFLIKMHGTVARATFDFFSGKGIYYVPVPETTGSASSPMEPGSDSEPVKAIIDKQLVLLTDSAQFHLEYGCRSMKQGCFYYGHSFRDEYPDVRHLSQFSHAEAEIPGTLMDVKKLVEEYIKYITKIVWRDLKSELKTIPGTEEKINKLLDEKFAFKTITFQEAYEKLRQYPEAFKKCTDSGWRITSFGEKKLLELMGDFIWIEHWDKLTVPFYQAYDLSTNTTFNADLLFGIGEVVGAGQRHETAFELQRALKEHGLSDGDYKWYIQLKEKYPMQTSGFGMGVERYLMWVLGVHDIRSVEIFPRNRLQTGEV